MSDKAMIKFIKIYYGAWILEVIFLMVIAFVSVPKPFALILSVVFVLCNFIILPIIGIKYRIPAFDKYYSFKEFSPKFSLFHLICYCVLLIIGISYIAVCLN